MATNFFQRWSSRSLTAKDKAVATSSVTNAAVTELAGFEQVVEPVDDANAQLNQTVIPD